MLESIGYDSARCMNCSDILRDLERKLAFICKRSIPSNIFFPFGILSRWSGQLARIIVLFLINHVVRQGLCTVCETKTVYADLETFKTYGCVYNRPEEHQHIHIP